MAETRRTPSVTAILHDYLGGEFCPRRWASPDLHENRDAQQLIPPFRLMNWSSGSEDRFFART
jgi:hypothetical protein